MRNRKSLGAGDVRFTSIYAFLMGWPEHDAKIRGLAGAAKIERVELLGSGVPVKWKQQPDGLSIVLSGAQPSGLPLR